MSKKWIVLCVVMSLVIVLCNFFGHLLEGTLGAALLAIAGILRDLFRWRTREPEKKTEVRRAGETVPVSHIDMVTPRANYSPYSSAQYGYRDKAGRVAILTKHLQHRGRVAVWADSDAMPQDFLLGGLGKTRLAWEFVLAKGKQNYDAWFWWRATDDFEDTAKKLCRKFYNIPRDKKWKVVEKYLEKTKLSPNPKFLLVIDNLELGEQLPTLTPMKQDTRNIESLKVFLRGWTGCQIIVTGRGNKRELIGLINDLDFLDVSLLREKKDMLDLAEHCLTYNNAIPPWLDCQDISRAIVEKAHGNAEYVIRIALQSHHVIFNEAKKTDEAINMLKNETPQEWAEGIIAQSEQYREVVFLLACCYPGYISSEFIEYIDYQGVTPEHLLCERPIAGAAAQRGLVRALKLLESQQLFDTVVDERYTDKPFYCLRRDSYAALINSTYWNKTKNDALSKLQAKRLFYLYLAWVLRQSNNVMPSPLLESSTGILLTISAAFELGLENDWRFKMWCAHEAGHKGFYNQGTVLIRQYWFHSLRDFTTPAIWKVMIYMNVAYGLGRMQGYLGLPFGWYALLKLRLFANAEPVFRVRTLAVVGMSYLVGGNVVRSIRCLQKAFQLRQLLDNQAGNQEHADTALTLALLALAMSRSKDVAQRRNAILHAEKALAIANSVGVGDVIALNSLNVMQGRVLLNSGEVKRALRVAEETLAKYVEKYGRTFPETVEALDLFQDVVDETSDSIELVSKGNQLMDEFGAEREQMEEISQWIFDRVRKKVNRRRKPLPDPK